MQTKSHYKKRYGNRIKKHLQAKSTFRYQLYKYIPARIFDMIIAYFFSRLKATKKSTYLIDLPYITLTYERTESYKSNINKKRLQRESKRPYVSFTQ